jgi:H+/Cl- antiporter ClcA
MFEKLKKRWNIKSNFQVVVIFVVFAITGTSTIYVKRIFYEIIGITPETHFWIKVLLYLPVILIIYNVLFYSPGSCSGNFSFF